MINVGRTMYYAGIGSRNIPKGIPLLMMKLAGRLEDLGFTLRSGGADGSDSAFEVGVTRKEIYLPWKGFNNNDSKYHKPTKDAYELSLQYHPAWHSLKDSVKSLMARNAHQVLGYDLKTPSDFVVCWTPDGAETAGQRSSKTGGTGQAIEIAYFNKIPVFNLHNSDAMERLKLHIESHPRYKQ